MPPRPLIVRLRNWIGDVILGVPALKLLAANGYDLQLVGKPWASTLLAGQGWPTVARPGHWKASVAQLRALRDAASRLDPGFTRRDNALVLPTSFSAALEMRLAGLRAVGYAQEARGFLLARSEPITYGGHALTAYWELACRFLRITRAPPQEIGLATREADIERADAMLRRHGIEPGFIVICPFAGGTFEKLEKTWPAFPDFARVLIASGRQVVTCPGPGEEAIVRASYPGVTMLEGVDLAAYGGVLRRCAMLVSNDTGPGHLAAAVGATVVSVLGPTKPEQWAPWGSRVHVIRRWPDWPTPDEVMVQVEALSRDRQS